MSFEIPQNIRRFEVLSRSYRIFEVLYSLLCSTSIFVASFED